jgi:hypothetical protein
MTSKATHAPVYVIEVSGHGPHNKHYVNQSGIGLPPVRDVKDAMRFLDVPPGSGYTSALRAADMASARGWAHGYMLDVVLLSQ